MKQPGLVKLGTYCALSIVFACALASCGANPSKQKAEFLASGEKYAKAGKYQEAVIQYRNAIAIDPRSAAAHYRLALAYMELKVPQQAYQEFLSAAELDPANTDAQLHAEILSYSRSRGAFVGISLDGATLRPDHDANAELYGKKLTNEQIVLGKIKSPASGAKLAAELNKYSARKEEAEKR